MQYPLSTIADIDKETLAALKSAGIRSTATLLDHACTAARRRQLAARLELDPHTLLCWANRADCMRVKGVSKEYAELLSAAGVATVKDLKVRNPANLAKRMAEANRQRKLVHLVPSQTMVARWIDSARELPLKIKY